MLCQGGGRNLRCEEYPACLNFEGGRTLVLMFAHETWRPLVTRVRLGTPRSRINKIDL